MIIDLNQAKVNKDVVLKWYTTKGYLDPKSAVAIAADMTQVPCITIAFWLAELLNFPEWLCKKIVVLYRFYKYTGLVNLPENVPESLIGQLHEYV